MENEKSKISTFFMNVKVLMFFIPAMILLIGVTVYMLSSASQEKAVVDQSTAPSVTGDGKTNNMGTPAEKIAKAAVEDDVEKSNKSAKIGESYVPQFPSAKTSEVNQIEPPKPPTGGATVEPHARGAGDSYAGAVDAYHAKLQSDTPQNANNARAQSDQFENLIKLAFAHSDTVVGGMGSKPEPQPPATPNPTGTPVQAQTSKNRLKMAGDSVMAEILMAINSERPGVVFAKITSEGSLKNAVLTGAASQNPDNTVSVTLSRLSLPGTNGETLTVTAVVIDPATGEPALTGDVNHKIFQRFIFPVLAATIAKAGEIASSAGTTVTTGTSSTTVTADVSTKNIAIAGIGAGAQALQGELSKGTDNKPTVRIQSNIPVEIKFVDDVVVNETK